MRLNLAESVQYEPGDLLGVGGEGEVRLATCRPGGETVAIKKLHGRRGHAFYQELAILVGHNHPNIVCLLDFYEQGTSRYLIYEYCSGGSLQDAMTARQAFTLLDLVRLARQVAAGLLHLHGRKVCHGDIKPGNILRKGTAGAPLWKIADFGVSRDAQRSTARLGYTPHFAAPERLEGRLLPESDTYALGVVLLDLLLTMPDDGPLVGRLRRLARAATRHQPEDRPRLETVVALLVRIETAALLSAHGGTAAGWEPIQFGGPEE